MPAAVARAVRYAQVDKQSVERNSQRSIASMTDVDRMTIAGRLKKALTTAPTAEASTKKAVGGARTR